jgi:DNA replication protein DnaC
MGCAIIGFCTKKLNKSALYVKAFDIFLDIREGMKGLSHQTEKQAIEKHTKPFLLVIDAFEVRGDTDFENRTMDYIIDKRYDDEKATIIISNDKKTDLERILGVSIVSRISQLGGIIEMKTEDFRGKDLVSCTNNKKA